jgi:uncharacterized membrane protein
MRWAVAAAAAAITAAGLCAPLLGPWGVGVYAGLAWVCHQRPERCWEVAGRPAALCIRCLGLYLGALLAAVAGLRFRKWPAAGAWLLLGLDWLVETLGFAGSRPAWRWVVGLLAGALAAPALWGELPRGQARRMEVRKEGA